MKCAAFELPSEPQETYADLEASETVEVLEHLERNQVLHESQGRFHWMARVFPANSVNLRSFHEENFVVIEVPTDRVLAEVDFRSAHTSLHDHAIYNIDSHQYQVERLDYENHKAYVRKVEPDYYTTAMTHTRVAVLDEEDAGSQGDVVVAHGEVLVSRRVVGFKKIRFHTNENVGYGDITLPDQEMHTTACWISLSQAALDALPFHRDTCVDGLRALSHALHTTATVALMCAGQDIGRAMGDESAANRVGGPAAPSSAPGNEADFDPTVFLYDNMPGGVGLAPEIHDRMPELILSALALMGDCACAGSG